MFSKIFSVSLSGLVLLLTLSLNIALAEEDLTVIEEGARIFSQNCVACHGADGTGGNVESLSKQPADLTKIRARNNGAFPMSEIYTIIDGSDGAHAEEDRIMPVWRDRFVDESVWEGCNQIDNTIADGRIMQLLMYLDSIQE